MAFLAGKQVLPDEIKIRDLAEQISLKSAQADPKVRTSALSRGQSAVKPDAFHRSTVLPPPPSRSE